MQSVLAGDVDSEPRYSSSYGQRQFSEMNNEVSHGIHIDLQGTAGTLWKRPLAVSAGVARIERTYSGRCDKAAGSRTLRGDRAGSAGRLAVGASLVALSPAEEGYRFSDSRDSIIQIPRARLYNRHRYTESVP